MVKICPSGREANLTFASEDSARDLLCSSLVIRQWDIKVLPWLPAHLRKVRVVFPPEHWQVGRGGGRGRGWRGQGGRWAGAGHVARRDGSGATHGSRPQPVDTTGVQAVQGEEEGKDGGGRKTRTGGEVEDVSAEVNIIKC